MKECMLCKTQSKKGCGVTFHQFPSDEGRLELWLKKIEKPGWRPKKYDYICSKHFCIWNKDGHPYTLRIWENRKKKTKYGTKSCQRRRSTSCNLQKSMHDIIKHDHRYESTLKSSKEALQRVKQSLKKSRARAKVLSQHVKRLKVNVSSLRTIITKLKKKLTFIVRIPEISIS